MRVDLRAEDIAAGCGANARREAVHDRPLLDERRHRIAQSGDGRAEDHCRVRGDYLIGQLHGNLRARLIIMHDRIDLLAVDAAVLVDHLLLQLERLLLLLDR